MRVSRCPVLPHNWVELLAPRTWGQGIAREVVFPAAGGAPRPVLGHTAEASRTGSVTAARLCETGSALPALSSSYRPLQGRLLPPQQLAWAVPFPLLFLSVPTTFLLSAAEIMDPYIPPEGDARLTSLSKDGLKQKVDKLKQTVASQLAYVPPF